MKNSRPVLAEGPIEGESMLVCPCGGDYLRQGSVEVWSRDAEDGPGTMVHTNGALVEVKRVEDGFIGRRGDLRIHFLCETCEWMRTLVIYQHKGQTFLYWSDSEDGAKTP